MPDMTCILYEFEVATPYCDVVKHVPTLGPGMPSRSFVANLHSKNYVFGGRVLFNTDCEKPSSAAVHLADTIPSFGAVPNPRVGSSPCI